jgi:hypothetical protein
MTVVKKVFAASLVAATLGASLVATPASARGWHHHHGYGGAVAAGVIGGLALGALAAGAAAQPADECWEERRPIYNRAGHIVGYRRVPVCN